MRLFHVAFYVFALSWASALQADPPTVADAIRAGNIDAVKAYLAAGNSANSLAGDGRRTLLSLAVQVQQQAVIEFLIAQGADVNQHDAKPDFMGSYDGVTPIDQAARNDDLEAAETLIAHGASVNPGNDDPFGPLINSSMRGSLQVADLLLAKGADVNQADVNGETPLHQAARKGRLEMIDLLLTHNAKLDRLDHSGDMPLGTALLFGQFAAARTLIDHKSPCNHLDLNDQSLLDIAVSNQQGIPVDADLMDKLLGCGVDIGAGKGTALTTAIYHNQVASARLLIAKGAAIPQPTPPVDGTLLHVVMRKSLGVELLDDLVKKGMDVNATNMSGQTPLMVVDLTRATSEAAGPMIEYLLAHGASINAADRRGNTLLNYAASANVDTGPWMEYLIGKGAKTDVRGMGGSIFEEGYTPLHLAASSGNLGALAALIAHGSDVNVRAGANSEGSTPLYIAISQKHFDCAKLLLQHGADPKLNNLGPPVIELAMNAGEYDLARDLRAHGAEARGIDLNPRPPAFFGGGCAKVAPSWKYMEAPIAQVTGHPSERLTLHPDYPPSCARGNKACDGKAYLVAGDRVVIGARCDEWIDVQFQGKGSTSWGWVDSSRLMDVGKADQVSVDHHPPIAAAPPGLCEAARGKLDESLQHPDKRDAPFPLVPLKFQTPEQPLPAALQQEVGNNNSTQIADMIIRGVKVKVVNYSSGGTCTQEGLEIWTHDYSKKLYGNSDDDGYSSEDLEHYGSSTYLVHTSRNNDVLMYGFSPEGEAAQMCSFRLVYRQTELIADATEPEVCKAVLDGKTEDVPTTKDEPIEVNAEALGTDADVPGGQWQYMLGPKAEVDLYNDGHPLPVAIATGEADSGASCGHHYQTAWPVVLGQNDMPDLSVKHVEAEGEQASLIRFHGTIYVDASSADGSESPSHVVWKVTRSGINKVCTFIPVRYASK